MYINKYKSCRTIYKRLLKNEHEYSIRIKNSDCLAKNSTHLWYRILTSPIPKF